VSVKSTSERLLPSESEGYLISTDK
jgi:hypothetical protein